MIVLLLLMCDNDIIIQCVIQCNVCVCINDDYYYSIRNIIMMCVNKIIQCVYYYCINVKLLVLLLCH